jgi:hypothetical protein
MCTMHPVLAAALSAVTEDPLLTGSIPRFVRRLATLAGLHAALCADGCQSDPAAPPAPQDSSQHAAVGVDARNRAGAPSARMPDASAMPLSGTKASPPVSFLGAGAGGVIGATQPVAGAAGSALPPVAGMAAAHDHDHCASGEQPDARDAMLMDIADQWKSPTNGNIDLILPTLVLDYSGFNDQNPDQAYSGSIERTVQNMDRFCRGVQVTDKQGVVRFRTVYPGWYNGRAIHIHFVALHPGSGPDTANYRSTMYMLFTTQMYFAEPFSRMIHENNMPYKARATGAAYDKYVKPQNTTVNPSARMLGNVAVAALNIITSGSGSRR